MTKNAPLLLADTSTNCLRFCALSQTEQHVGEVACSDERVLVVWPDRAGPYCERRLQDHRLRALSKAHKHDSQVRGQG